MANYGTLASALARLGRNGDLSGSTVPTLTEAASIHDGITGEIDAALTKAGLTPPVSSPASLVAWLGAVEAYGLCAEVLKVRFQDATGPNSEASWAFFERRYQAAIERLWKGEALDEMAGSPVMPQSYFTRNPDVAEDLGDLVAPTLTTTMEL